MGRKKKTGSPPARFLIQGWFREDIPQDKAVIDYFKGYMIERGIDSQKYAIYDAVVALSSCQAAEIDNPAIILPPRSVDSQIKQETEHSLQKLYDAISQLTGLIRDGVLVASSEDTQRHVSHLTDQLDAELSDLESSAVSMFTAYTFEDEDDE